MKILVGFEREPEWESHFGVVVDLDEALVKKAFVDLKGVSFAFAGIKVQKACFANDLIDEEFLAELTEGHFDEGFFLDFDAMKIKKEEFHDDFDLFVQMIVCEDGRFYFTVDDDSGGHYETYSLTELEPAPWDEVSWILE